MNLTFTITGDGLIKMNELKAVLKACTDENQLTLSEEQLDQLVLALYQDASNQTDFNVINDEGISYDQLKAQMESCPGLLDNLSIWFV